jgi:hypothetical protein
MAPLGLLAGGGAFPEYLLSALKQAGHEVVVVGIEGETPEGLVSRVPRSALFDIGNFKGIVAFLKDAGVREAFMAGSVAHTNIYREGRRDSLATRFLSSIIDKRADSLLKGAVFILRSNGIKVVSAMPYLKPLIPVRGILTRRAPAGEERKDIAFGLKMARRIAGLDIGQTVVVKHLAVVAVESLEGTDACIRRGGEIGKGGVVVAKVAKPRQDFRFDVPVVGLRTVESLKAARASAMAVEAGKTIILDRERVVTGLDEAGIALEAV